MSDAWKGTCGFNTPPRNTKEVIEMITTPHHDMCDEVIKVEVFQLHQFERLGFTPLQSVDAVRDHLDWHEVENLMKQGCSRNLAIQIATPL